MVSRQRGFSFAEVMIAAAILATLGSSLLGGQNVERSAITASFDQLQAETIAQGALETLRTQRITLVPGTTALDGLPSGFRGTTTLEALLPGLLSATVRVEGGQLPHAYVLHTRITTEVLR